MHVRKSGEYIEASLITGPTHNTLWLRLTDAPEDSFQIERQPPRLPIGNERIDEQAVIEAITFGVHYVSTHVQAQYHIRAVKYHFDDTARYIIYALLAHHITLFCHAERLQQDHQRRRPAFFIESVEHLHPGKWRAGGRSLEDIQSEDFLFVEQPDGQFSSYEVGVPATPSHKAGKLPMNTTGMIVLQGNNEQEMKTHIYLYR
jgi:hypothetical protein